jgi:hypothetical protein
VWLFSDCLLYINEEVSRETGKYGAMQHEIDYDKNNVSETEVNKIASAFTSAGFFDNTVTKYVYLDKADNRYELFISCHSSICDSEEDIAAYTQLRSDLQALIPENKIILFLVVDSIDNVVKRIE